MKQNRKNKKKPNIKIVVKLPGYEPVEIDQNSITHIIGLLVQKQEINDMISHYVERFVTDDDDGEWHTP